MLVIFLFYSNQTIILKFRDFFTTCHPNMPFSFEKKNNEMSFLDVGISQENGKFVLFTVNLLLVVFMLLLQSFLPSTNKFGMLYTLSDNIYGYVL